MDAPESMYHSEDGGASVMVLNTCISWFWSQDAGGAKEDGATAYAGDPVYIGGGTVAVKAPGGRGPRRP